MCINYAKKEPKMRLSAVFSRLVHGMDMMLHILLELNDLNDLAIVSRMLDHEKIRKLHLCMIQRA